MFWHTAERREGGIYVLQERIPCAISTKFAEYVPCFRVALAVKSWLDLLSGLWSSGGFKLRESGYSQIFSAPYSGETTSDPISYRGART